MKVKFYSIEEQKETWIKETSEIKSEIASIFVDFVGWRKQEICFNVGLMGY